MSVCILGDVSFILVKERHQERLRNCVSVYTQGCLFYISERETPGEVEELCQCVYSGMSLLY